MDWGSFAGGAAKMGMFNDELEEKRRERAQRDAQFQQSYTLQKNADQRAATESEYQNMVRSAHTAHQKKYQDILGRINSGNMEDVPQLISAYNRNQGALKDDHTIHMMSGLGGKQMASVRGPDGKVVSEHEMTPQTIRQAIMSMAAMEAAALPGADMGKFYQSERDHGLKVDELGMKRGYYKSEENKNNVQAEWMPKLNQSTINYQAALGHAAGLRAEHSGGAAGYGQPIAVSDDGKYALFRNPKGGAPISIPMPEGFSKFFTKITGTERPPRPDQQWERKKVDPKTGEELTIKGSGEPPGQVSIADRIAQAKKQLLAAEQADGEASARPGETFSQTPKTGLQGWFARRFAAQPERIVQDPMTGQDISMSEFNRKYGRQ